MKIEKLLKINLKKKPLNMKDNEWVIEDGFPNFYEFYELLYNLMNNDKGVDEDVKDNK